MGTVEGRAGWEGYPVGGCFTTVYKYTEESQHHKCFINKINKHNLYNTIYYFYKPTFCCFPCWIRVQFRLFRFVLSHRIKFCTPGSALWSRRVSKWAEPSRLSGIYRRCPEMCLYRPYSPQIHLARIVNNKLTLIEERNAG